MNSTTKKNKSGVPVLITFLDAPISLHKPTFLAKRLWEYRSVILIAVYWLTVSVSFAAEKAPTISEKLKLLVNDLQTNGKKMVCGKQITANRILIDMYAQNHYQPLWKNTSTARQLVAEIDKSRLDGLRPNDYHLDTLIHQGTKPSNGTGALCDQAEHDLIHTDAFIRLSFHLYFGKVDPRSQHPRWPVPKYIGNQKAFALLLEQINAGRIETFIDSLRPRHPMYHRLMTALSVYQKVADAGGWPEIPAGPLIEKGDHDSRVPLIRQRLLATRDLRPNTVDSGDLFNDDLENATALFQDRHRIDTSAPGIDDRYGAVGTETREQMNLDVEHRINQIRVNLERARWVMHHLPSAYLIADIADFSVILVENDQVVWRSRVQVGDAYRKTPAFRSTIKYMEINPTWTVPPGILDDSILPKLRKNAHSRELNQFDVYDLKGKLVKAPEKIPWDDYCGRNLPFRLVQKPGPTNPMGQIKFIFPNPDFVFIHDTPQRQFFNLDRRNLSAGCIRIESPFELAEHLMRLDGQEGDKSIEDLLKSGQTGRVNLNNPFPIILIYGTVSVDDQGIVSFREDIYDRDPELIESLSTSAVLWRKASKEAR